MPTLLEKAGAALSQTLERVTHLRVITVLGEAEISGPISGPSVQLPEMPVASMITSIDLVAGDVTNVASPLMLEAEQAGLRAMHEASVKQAQAIVEGNIRTLTELLRGTAQVLRGLDAPLDSPPADGPPSGAPPPGAPPPGG